MHCSDKSQEHSKKIVKGPTIAEFEAALARAESPTVTDAEGRT